jgi:integrase/recombinase XerD
MFDRQGNRKYLNANERRAFLTAVVQEPDALRRAFCLTLFHSGCRISEALDVVVDRVDLNGVGIVFETLKQRKKGVFRSVPVPDSLMELLHEIMSHAGPLDRLWSFSRPTAYRLIKEYMVKATIIGNMASPKGLRHGFAVACLAQKIPLPTVQKWLGHSRLETTAIYLEVSGEEERELARRLWTDI